jgi:hypothetical protein
MYICILDQHGGLSMTVKTSRRCVRVFSLVFLVACGRQTVILPTETSVPNVVSSTPVPTSILIPVTITPFQLLITPSPLPTEPIIPLLTPDANQVERWNEYEEALAKAFFKSYFQPEEAVCEWVILGQADRVVYVWADCTGIYSAGPSAASIPAAIHIATDGSIESVEIPGDGTAYGPSVRRIFPPNVQEKIFSNQEIFSQAQVDRLRWRRAHPNEPPLIVLPFLPAQPTQPIIPWITPDAIQIERWKEYQTALAEKFDYRPPEEVICEWEILGRSGNEVYVWTVCGAIRDNRVGLEGLAIIYVGDNGTIQNVATSGAGGFAFPSEIRNAFSPDVQEKYFNGLIHFQELVDHLRWRQSQENWDEPPLIVINATPKP